MTEPISNWLVLWPTFDGDLFDALHYVGHFKTVARELAATTAAGAQIRVELVQRVAQPNQRALDLDGEGLYSLLVRWGDTRDM